MASRNYSDVLSRRKPAYILFSDKKPPQVAYKRVDMNLPHNSYSRVADRMMELSMMPKMVHGYRINSSRGFTELERKRINAR